MLNSATRAVKANSWLILRSHTTTPLIVFSLNEVAETDGSRCGAISTIL